jgi:hypothetical protein
MENCLAARRLSPLLFWAGLLFFGQDGNIGQSPFDRTVTERSKALFCVFLTSNRVQFFGPSRLPNLLFG